MLHKIKGLNQIKIDTGTEIRAKNVPCKSFLFRNQEEGTTLTTMPLHCLQRSTCEHLCIFLPQKSNFMNRCRRTDDVMMYMMMIMPTVPFRNNIDRPQEHISKDVSYRYRSCNERISSITLFVESRRLYLVKASNYIFFLT